MSGETHVVRFYKNLSGLTDFIYVIVQKLFLLKIVSLNPSVIKFASGVVEAMDHNVILRNFIENSHYRQCLGLDPKDDVLFLHNRCKNKAFFNVPQNTRAEYCHDHQLHGMINHFPQDTDIKEIIKQPRHWDKINERDEKFMEENAFAIFRIVPAGNVNEFRKIFQSKNDKGEYIVGKEDRDIIWDYLETFVRISLRYIHDEREPYSIMVDGKKKFNYHVKYVRDIDLTYHGKKWEIQEKFLWPLKA